MAVQLSPDEKFELITRNLQVSKINLFTHIHLSLLNINFAGGSWRGEAEADLTGEGAQCVLGHSYNRKTTCGILCAHV